MTFDHNFAKLTPMTDKKPTSISEEDKALFRQAVSDMRPIKKKRMDLAFHTDHPTPRILSPLGKKALPVSELSNYTIGRDIPLVTGSEPLTFRRPGVQEQRLRKLRQKRFPVEASLDLHGMSLATAEEQTQHFLARARARRQRCVCIVHGKGLHSSERYPRLKNHIYRLLIATPEALAFCSALPQDGGSGALYVLL